MTGLFDDVRLAVRRLRHQPGFALVVIGALALGLGSNTAIFTLLHGVMFQTLPVPRAHELHRLGNNHNCCVNSGMQGDFSLFSTSLFEALRADLADQTTLMAFQANVTATGVRLDESGAQRSLRAAYVSANYFDVLAIKPAIGRLFEPIDDEPGSPPVAIVSHQTWMSEFGSAPDLPSRYFYVNGIALRVAGVAPAGFFGETVRPDPPQLWLPLGQERRIRGSAALAARPGQHWLYAVGRLSGSVGPSDLGARATQSLRRWFHAQSFPTERDRASIGEQRITATSASGGVQLMRANFGQALLLLLAMSGLVLLITAANLANLLLSRADRGQAAVRAAMGAAPSRLMRQAFVEGGLLALLGGAAATLVATAGTRAVLSTAFATPSAVPLQATPSGQVLAFSFILALVTALLFSAAPAWAVSRANPIDALRGLGRDNRDVAFMPRRSLVVIQVMLCMVLLAGAGVLVKSLGRLQAQPLGFEPNHRVVVRIDPPSLLAEPERLIALYGVMRDRLRALPGVLEASYALYSPFEGNNWSGPIAIAGQPFNPEGPSPSWNRVGPNYFETVGTRVLRGRGITERDSAGASNVAVVNAAFARRFFGSAEPLGARLGLFSAAHAADFEIVGVVEDVKYTAANLPARPMAFFPVAQSPAYAEPEARQVLARSALVRAVVLQVAPGTPDLESAIRQALAATHPDLIVTRVLTLADQVSGNFRTDRLLAGLTSAYGALALALAALGLFAVTSYGVSRRQQEIGVRMALGADRRAIVRSVVRGALAQTMAGLALGLPLAWWAGGLVASRLYEVQARDPVVLVVAALVLVATAVAAALWPARRAASVDPTRALRG